jgi:hypothetical protein
VAGAVIGDLDPHLVGAAGHHDAAAGRGGVLDDVGHRLLDDPADRQLKRRGKPVDPADVQVDLDAGQRRSLGEPRQVAEPGRWAVVGGRVAMLGGYLQLRGRDA